MTRRTIENRQLPVRDSDDAPLVSSDISLPPAPQQPAASAHPEADKALPQQMFSTAFGMTIQQPSRPATTTTKKKFLTIIKADLLIPGDGDPIPDAALVVENRLIAWIGPHADIPEKYTAAPHHRSFSVPFLMPGLWDVHTHFDGGSPTGEDGPGFTGFISMHPASSGARLARGCWEALQRGYTSLRDVAGFGCEVSRAIEDGTIVGPNVYGAGACLSQTAGHGDVFQLPAGVVYQNLGVAHVAPGHFGAGMSIIVDGVEECRRAVRLQIRRGAKCIKILASGGVMSRDDNVIYAQFSEEELKVIVEEAARQGRSVAAHVHAKAGIIAAVNAGVKSLEHVTFADEECINLIKEKEVVYVATQHVVNFLLSTGGVGLEPSVWEKAKLCAKHSLGAYKMAIASKCTFAMGTDSPPGFNMAIELEYAVKAGLSNLEAIKAATVNGALTVGEQAPKTGQLKVGYEADMLGLLKNPVEDVRVLQKKDNINWVWKGGRLFKGPGVGPWGEGDYWDPLA